MSRQQPHPAVLLADRSAKRGQQHIWEAVRQLSTFGVTDLTRLVNKEAIPAAHTTRRKVLNYVNRLVGAGYLRELPESSPVSYALVRNPGITAPAFDRKGNEKATGPIAAERLWCAARVLGNFNADELAMHAEVNLAATWEYIIALEKAGYFLLMAKKSADGKKRYQFSRERDSGPEAPQVVMVQAVKDPNQDQFVYADERAGLLT